MASAALAVAFVLVLSVGLGLALLAFVWDEWPREREMDRESAEDVARRDRNR